MNNKSNIPVSTEYFLKPGFIFVAVRPTVISTVTGSSVSLCIHDRKQKIGGMNHFIYPFADKKMQTTAEYGNVAITCLLRMLLNNKCKLKNLEAQIMGGSYNQKLSTEHIGQKNIAIVKKILDRRVSVVSEDVGGKKGRKVVFNSATGEVAVFKTDNIRESDWYPYINDR